MVLASLVYCRNIEAIKTTEGWKDLSDDPEVLKLLLELVCQLGQKDAPLKSVALSRVVTARKYASHSFALSRVVTARKCASNSFDPSDSD